MANPQLIAIGMFPPPIDGKTIALEGFVKKIQNELEVIIINLSSTSAKSRRRMILTKFIKSLFTPVDLFNYIKNKDSTIIYLSPDAGLGNLAYTYIIALTRLLGYRLCIHHHTYKYLYRRSILLTLINWFAGKNAAHIFLCAHMYEKYAALYGKKKNTFIISNWVYQPIMFKDASHFKRTNLKKIGLLSNLTIEKGLDLAIQTIRLLIQNHINVQLILAGPLVGVKEKELIKNLDSSIADFLCYPGPVYGNDKENFFKEIDIFLFPTKYLNEAQPIVLIEALSYGVPIISYERGCIAELLSNDGGVIIKQDQSFPEEALRLISQWHNDSNALNKAIENTLNCALAGKADAEKAFGDLLKWIKN